MKLAASWVRTRFPGFGAAILMGLSSTALLAQKPSDVAMTSLPLAGVRFAWQWSIPLQVVGKINSWTLVDGRIYALGEDAIVRVARADTGESIWSKKLGERFNRLWPPTGYESDMDPSHNGVLFTLADSAVLLDREQGMEVKRIRFETPTLAAAAGANGYVYVATPDCRLRCVRVSDSVQIWQASSPAPLDMAPLCIQTTNPSTGFQENLVLFADSGKTMAAVWGRDYQKLFAYPLEDRAIGWLAADENAVYVATANGLLDAIGNVAGNLLWDYHLPGAPVGGPIVTRTSVYQQTANHVLQRVSKDRTGLNWRLENAAQFLAEWGNHVAVRQPNGHIALVQLDTGRPIAMIDAGLVAGGISNPHNAAIFVHDGQGHLKCYLPADSQDLALRDFLPHRPSPATQTAPADESKTDESKPDASKTGASKKETATTDGSHAAAEPAKPAVRPEDALRRDPLRRR